MRALILLGFALLVCVFYPRRRRALPPSPEQTAAPPLSRLCATLRTRIDHRAVALCFEGAIYDERMRRLGTTDRPADDPDVLWVYDCDEICRYRNKRGWVEHGILYSLVRSRPLGRYEPGVIRHPFLPFVLFRYAGEAEHAAAAALLILRQHEDGLDDVTARRGEGIWNGA